MVTEQTEDDQRKDRTKRAIKSSQRNQEIHLQDLKK